MNNQIIQNSNNKMLDELKERTKRQLNEIRKMMLEQSENTNTKTETIKEQTEILKLKNTKIELKNSLSDQKLT